MRQRLQKAIAAAGVTSRRSAEILIVEKRITVNGEIARIGMSVDTKTDTIQLDGENIVMQKKQYLLSAAGQTDVRRFTKSNGSRSASVDSTIGVRARPPVRNDSPWQPVYRIGCFHGVRLVIGLHALRSAHGSHPIRHHRRSG